jgi:hypothetical protein
MHGASPLSTKQNFFDEHTDDEDESTEDDFQFGIWLRHRRIDGALNRVPPDFYAVNFGISYFLCIIKNSESLGYCEKVSTWFIDQFLYFASKFDTRGKIALSSQKVEEYPSSFLNGQKSSSNIP